MRCVSLALLLYVWPISCREVETEKPFTTGLEGQEMPAFTIQLIDSVSYINTKDLPKGKEIVLFYFSATCPFCRAQMRDIVNNPEIYKGKQFCIVSDGQLAPIKQFVEYFKLASIKDVIIGRDTGIVIPRKYGLMRVPFTAFFDKNKSLKVSYAGRVRKNVLLNAN